MVQHTAAGVSHDGGSVFTAAALQYRHKGTVCDQLSAGGDAVAAALVGGLKEIQW